MPAIAEPVIARPAAASIEAFPAYGAPIGLADARILAQGVAEKARTEGWRMAVAVVDPAGELVLFEKGDDTQYGSTQLAIEKARGATRYRRRTGEFEDQFSHGAMHMLTAAHAVALDGGIPVVTGGVIVGAIGVSGETSAQDAQAALSGLAFLAANIALAQTVRT